MAGDDNDNMPKEINFRSKDMVQILTKFNGKTTLFSIERGLWKTAEPTLAAATDSDLRDGKIEVLQKFSPHQFNRYLNYLVHGKISGRGVTPEFRSKTHLFVFGNLYYDGERLKDDRYKDAIVDAAANYFDEHPSWPMDEAASSVTKTVNTVIWKDDDNPFKRLVFDMWAKRATNADIAGYHSGTWALQPEDRAGFNKNLHAAFIRNRSRNMDHYDEEEKAIFKVSKPINEPAAKRQRTE